MAKTNASASSSLSNNVAINECKYKGVWKRKWGKYVSEIRFPNSRQRIWLGSYDTAEKAARAFDAALFLLRGPNANFNFPDDPPNIAVGHSLTPAEIQAVAQQHGNSFSGSCKSHDKDPEEDTWPRSNSDDHDHQIDWSFLDSLELNDERDVNVSSFGVFPEGDDMYIPPNFSPGDTSDNVDQYGSIGDLSSSLWNFDSMEH